MWASMRLLEASKWWKKYFEVAPPVRVRLDGRPRQVVRIWSDAAGDTQTLAAIIEFNGQWSWTSTVIPADIAKQFCFRSDEQIMMLELLAVPLALRSFSSFIGEESLMDFQGPRKAIPRKRRGSASRRLGNRDPEKARIERDNAMLVRHMTDIQTARRPAPRPFLGGHKAASAIRRKETSRKILRENHKIAARLEAIGDTGGVRSSGYAKTRGARR